MWLKEIHASQISSYQICPRMFRYQYVDKIVPKVTDPKLFIGRACHAGLAGHYSGRDALEAYEEDIRNQLEAMAPYVDSEQMARFDEQIELGRKLIQTFVSWAKEKDSFRAIAVEQSFAIPIFRPDGKRVRNAHLVGTFDGIAEDVYGNIWLLEHKTYKSTPSETVLRLDGQAGYYLLAASYLYPNRRVVGVIYTILRKVDPARAKSSVVERYMVMRNPHELAGLQKRLFYIHQQIAKDNLYIPAPGFHCGWRCPYRQLCIAEEDGSDVGGIKDMLFTTGEPALLLDEEVN